MKMKYLLALICALSLFSCRDRLKLDRDAVLEYSSDTILLDTVFTDMGTPTRQWKIYNRSEGIVQIDNISADQGDASQYVFNIDGKLIGQGQQVELRPGDSVYVFVQARLRASGTDTALMYREYLSVTYNSRTDHIPVISYGQDVHKLYGQSIGTQTWVGPKPYLIFDSLHIQAGQTLTIGEGVTVFCHAGARIIADGTLICNGSQLRPVVFKSDNWDTSYYDIPNQWGSIVLRDSTAQYRFSHTRMLRGTNGIIAQYSAASTGNITLDNVEILHMGSAGVAVQNTNLLCSNTVIGDCSAYSMLIGGAGNYRITHATLSKMNPWGYESVPALRIMHIGADKPSVRVANSIIAGSRTKFSEIGLPDSLGADIVIDHCVVTAYGSLLTDTRLQNCLALKDTARLFQYDSDPNFMLDSVSVARNFGSAELMGQFVTDKLGNPRNVDLAPDAGAYEYFKSEK